MKKTWLSMIAMALCAGMALGLGGCGTSQADLDHAVGEAVAPLNEEIGKLSRDIADKESELETLEDEKTALTTERSELEADVAALEAEKATLADQKNALEAEKATLTAKVNELEGQITALAEQVTTLEAKVSADAAEITGLKAEIAALISEKAELENQVTNLNETVAAKNLAIAELETSIEALEAEKQVLADSVVELESLNEALESENVVLKIKVDCFEGNHVINTEQPVSYVYTWDEAEPTSVQIFTCLHCEKEVEAPVSPSVWQAGDKVTYVAKDGNAYESTVGEASDGKAVLVSDTDYSVTGKYRKDALLSLLEPVGARFVVIDEASYDAVIIPWLTEVVLYSSYGGSQSQSFAFKKSDDSTWYYLYKSAGGYITYGNAWDAHNYSKTWVYRYIWDVEFNA